MQGSERAGPSTTGIDGQDCFRYNNNSNSQIDLVVGAGRGGGGGQPKTHSSSQTACNDVFLAGFPPHAGGGGLGNGLSGADLWGGDSGKWSEEQSEKTSGGLKQLTFSERYRGPAAARVLHQTLSRTQPEPARTRWQSEEPPGKHLLSKPSAGSNQPPRKRVRKRTWSGRRESTGANQVQVKMLRLLNAFSDTMHSSKGSLSSLYSGVNDQKISQLQLDHFSSSGISSLHFLSFFHVHFSKTIIRAVAPYWMVAFHVIFCMFIFINGDPKAEVL